MTTEEEIEQLEDAIRIREIADDGYYISNQRKEDEQDLRRLQQKLKQEQMTALPQEGF